MPCLRAILFDLDDTLYPERDFVRSGFRAVADWLQSQWGCDSESTFQQLWHLSERKSQQQVFDRWLQSNAPDKTDRVTDLVSVYRAHIPDIALSSEVVDLLLRLRKSHRLGVVTDGWLSVQQRKIEALRLTNYVDTVIISDQWGTEYWKPHPRPYLEALSQLHVDPSSALFVGDNPRKDFLGARRAGIRSVQVCHENGVYAHEKPTTREHEPDDRISSWNQLEPLIFQFNTDHLPS